MKTGGALRNPSLKILAILVLGLFAFAPAPRAAIPQAERDALLALYASTGGSEWTDSTNWGGPPGSENTWHGVVTDAANTTVLELRLESNNLAGTLPPELADLTNLETIRIDGNRIVAASTLEEDSVERPCAASAGSTLADAPQISGYEFKHREQNGVVLVCKLTLYGQNFQPDCAIKINGQPAPKSVFVYDNEVVAKGGAKLKKMLPKGQVVQVTVTNPDGQTSNPYPFTRP